MNDLWLSTLPVCFSSSSGGALLAQSNPVGSTVDWLNQLLSPFIAAIPNLVGAFLILVAGWIIATVVASIAKGILDRTDLDNKIAAWVTGQATSEFQVEKWVSAIVYWLILLSAITLAANNLGVSGFGGPLGDIFGAIPQVIGAAILAGLAWLIACIARTLLIKALGGFKLDDKLSAAGGADDETPFLVNETLGDIVYWLILLFFLPLILGASPIPASVLSPVTDMVGDVVGALPNILHAGAIGLVGWLIAKVVKNIITNVLRSIGADTLDDRLGIPDSFELSTLGGTLAYIAVLVPAIVSALGALQIKEISEPATAMLNEVTTFLPLMISAAFIIGVFYFIGRLISEIVATFLAGLGFDNLFEWLGVSGLQSMLPEPTTDGTPEPYVRESEDQGLQGQTPSKLAGTLVLIGFVLVGLNTATDVLQLEQLTAIVDSILAVAVRVLGGVVVFAIGLFFANFAYRLVASAGTSQSNMLAQAARISIIVFVGAMALERMGVATSIVNLAFGLLLGAIAVAIAIAFGLGGRDIANEEIRGFLNSFRSR
ncbi:MAG: mechanosensitive ion channel [Cyanobacteria bacterium P01_F01_bin.150]